MKITILGTAHPYRGGLATFNERLAKQFQDEGHEVKVITFTLQYPSFLFPGKTQYTEDPKPEGLDIQRSLNSCNPISWIRLGKRIKKETPDRLIIKFWIPYMAPALGTVARIAKQNGVTQVVSILDNVIPHEPHFWDKWLIRYFVKSVDAFVAMSESVKNDLRLFTKNKPCTLARHPLYDNFGKKVSKTEAAKHLGLDSKYRYLLFFGLIRDYKGLDLLLEAFADKKVNKENARLIVAGEFYGNEEKYTQQLHALGLEDSVIWHTHFIADDEVRYYFSLASMIVQPYKSATQSGVTQIGYHFEKPMLVTNVGGLAEIVPDGKVGYVTEVNKDSIANALVDFLSYPDESRFEKGILLEKKKYGWDIMTKSILEL